LDARREGASREGRGEGAGGVSNQTESLLVALLLTVSGVAVDAQDRDTTSRTACSWSAERKAIVGVIVDPVSREPLRGARLVLSPKRPIVAESLRSAQSDSLGRFCFAGLQPGLYQLRPSAVDSLRYPYGPGEQLIEVRLSQSDTAHHVTIQYDPFGLPPAEVARRRERLAELQVQRRKWERTRPARYRLYVEVVCFCVPMDRPTFEVMGDSVVAIYGVAGTREDLLKEWPSHTVEYLFDELEEELRNQTREVTWLSYHPRYGFPTRYDSDARGGAGHDDTWFKLRVTFSEVRGP
jgi:hypothetical protein